MIRARFFLTMIAFIGGCVDGPHPSANPGNPEHQYYILEKQDGSSFVVTTKCGLYNTLDYDDSILTISYHMSGAFKYRISGKSIAQDSSVIISNAEIVNIGHVDSTIFSKFRFDKITQTTTRVIVNKSDYNETIDTLYVTKGKFIDHYKTVVLECEKKVQ